ncbi:hypothetical protein ACIQXW_15140 [Lysinibacillus sp. NPDC097162]|uniref:hypothetical protein n=1 Tax=Lysinibacillus sp. NPDC097162 TaxID=3364140 RepID=UPI00380B8A49
MLAQSESTLIQSILELSGITPEKVSAELDRKIEDYSRAKKIAWTIEEMSWSTGIKKEYLDKHILKDHRMKVFERRRGKGLRVWMYDGSAEALKEILDEWY